MHAAAFPCPLRAATAQTHTLVHSLPAPQLRREFVLSLPRGALPRDERDWWAGIACPPLWQVLLLFQPALSLAVFRILAQAAPL